MFRKSLFGFLSLGLIALGSSDAKAGSAIGSYTATGTSTIGSYNLGFDFMAKTAMTVTSLGVYDTNFLNSNQNVYLYDVTTNTLLATAVLTAPGSAGLYNYGSINAVILNTTDTYSVFSNFTGGSGQLYTTGSNTLSSDLTAKTISNGLFYGFAPTNGSTTPPSIGYGLLSTDFIYTSGVIPEPASVTMLGLGLAGVAFAARRKMAKRSA